VGRRREKELWQNGCHSASKVRGVMRLIRAYAGGVGFFFFLFSFFLFKKKSPRVLLVQQ